MVLARGLADRPVAGLGGKTPLQAARTPALDRLAAAGFSGVWSPAAGGAHPSLDGFLRDFFDFPESLSAGLMLAVAAGVPPREGEAVFRLSFVCLKPGATSVVMLDPAGFGVTDEENRELLRYLERHMPPDAGESFRFESLGGHQALLFYRGAGLSPASFRGFSPPHAIAGQPIGAHMPVAEAARRFVHFVNDSQMVLSTHAGLREKARERMFAANSAWLWGGGLAAEAARVSEKTGGRAAALVTDSALARGFAKLGRADVYEPGENASKAVCEALSKHDFVLSIPEVDEISPWREAVEKVAAIERLDAGFLSPLLETLRAPCRVLVAADGGFSVEAQEWTADTAPFAMADFDGERLSPPRRPWDVLASVRAWAGGGKRRGAAAGFSEALVGAGRVQSLHAVRKRLLGG